MGTYQAFPSLPHDLLRPVTACYDSCYDFNVQNPSVNPSLLRRYASRGGKRGYLFKVQVRGSTVQGSKLSVVPLSRCPVVLGAWIFSLSRRRASDEGGWMLEFEVLCCPLPHSHVQAHASIGKHRQA